MGGAGGGALITGDLLVAASSRNKAGLDAASSGPGWEVAVLILLGWFVDFKKTLTSGFIHIHIYRASTFLNWKPLGHPNFL